MHADRRIETGSALTLLLAFLCALPVTTAQEAAVIFGGSGYYPPFHYSDPSGTATGYDVEVFRASVPPEWSLQFSFGDWDLVQAQLAAGEIDVVPMFVSPERQERYLFSDAINIEYHLLFGRPDAQGHRSLATIGGYRVAMEGGAYAREQLRSLAPDAQVVDASSEADALHLVISGGADLALLPATIARYTIEQEQLEGLQIVSPLLLPVTYAFAVSPVRPDLLRTLNEGILALQRSGELQLLRERWLEPGADPPRDTVFWSAVALALFSALLASFLWWRRHRHPADELDAESQLLLEELRKAIANKSLAWVYQPQYDVQTQKITGAEMLARWHHPLRGHIAPDVFIVLAERAGIIKDITTQALNQAIATLQAWSASDLRYRLSVNVSANDLADRGVVERISQALGARGEFLTVEITETALMKDTHSILANIELLRLARVQISLDDYGTGYSSLESLRRFAFDEIKIDKTFINGIVQSERNFKLTQASISLGHDLGALVVAEGVEDEETIDMLVKTGCDILQGYSICRPMAVEEFVAFSQDFNRNGNQDTTG